MPAAFNGFGFKCTECGKEVSPGTAHWRCPDCGGAFVLTGARSFRKQMIREQVFSIWRYGDLWDAESPVTLGEGCTSLVPAAGFQANLLFKLESLNPTGAFKDRGMSVMITFLRANGVREVVEDSSGNAAASLSAYSASAGMRARIFIPESTSSGKARQIKLFGAEVVPVRGARIEATRAAERAAEEGIYYASHFWNPFALEGLKTLAYEVAEQLGWEGPDNVVVPCGHGTLLLGAYYGFRALVEARILPQMPRLFAIQAAACRPIAAAFEAGHKHPVPVESGETIAEGIRIVQPPRGREVLRVLRETCGAALSVEDKETLQAHEDLARCGLFVEETSAVAVAGLRRLVHSKRLRPTERTVVVLTGNGLKTLRTG